MIDKENKKEEKTDTVQADQEEKGRERKEPAEKKETLAERAKREGWTDVAESHLGIDE
jgi:hypothetical protein